MRPLCLPSELPRRPRKQRLTRPSLACTPRPSYAPADPGRDRYPLLPALAAQGAFASPLSSGGRDVDASARARGPIARSPDLTPSSLSLLAFRRSTQRSTPSLSVRKTRSTLSGPASAVRPFPSSLLPPSRPLTLLPCCAPDYSRATRLLSAAQKVASSPSRLLPSTAAALEKDVPGVGPYTAGAIASIVQGHNVPLVDGNVQRVLARLLGVYADPKAKAVNVFVWERARELVEAVEEGRGGDWNEGLMEVRPPPFSPRASLEDGSR